MRLVEAILAIFVLVLLLMWWASLLWLAWVDVKHYTDSLPQDALKLSIYNYTDYLVSQATTDSSWYISYSQISNNFILWISGDYYYECHLVNWILFILNSSYTAVFCEVDFDWEKIFWYRFLN